MISIYTFIMIIVTSQAFQQNDALLQNVRCLIIVCSMYSKYTIVISIVVYANY